MGETRDESAPEPRHSAAADAAAIRWGETHPDEDVTHPPPAAPPEDDERVPNRHSASAESAAERLRSRDDTDG
jgi:hypothetical protein